ncbi:MAG TPA: TIGR01777 family oxidoreductase [Solirubrobacterales bacterium]
MRVLVTGASGLIGSAVCDALLARGDEVVGLSRDPARARATNPTVTWLAWNPETERPPEDAVEGTDGVVNLLGEPLNQRWSEDAKRRIRASRIDATRNLIQGIHAATNGPKAMVSQSAVGYYGDRGETIVDEAAGPGSEFDARVVVDWEAAAKEAEGDLRLVILRTGLVLTQRGGLLKELLTPFKLGVGGPLAGGGQYWPWISLDDEVGLILWALDDERVSGTLNATGPAPVTNREFSKALGRALGRPAIVPAPKLALVARFGAEAAESLAGGQRAVPRRALDLGYEFRHPDVDSAIKAALAD